MNIIQENDIRICVQENESPIKVIRWAVNYYGNQQQIITGATTIQVIFFADFGKPNEK